MSVSLIGNVAGVGELDRGINLGDYNLQQDDPGEASGGVLTSLSFDRINQLTGILYDLRPRATGVLWFDALVWFPILFLIPYEILRIVRGG
jgi:hypothetical protein